MLLDAVQRWAAAEPGIVGVALVGSHARGAQTPDSDVDLVVLCAAPQRWLDGDWASQFGAIRAIAKENYGKLCALRIVYEAGLEVEFGIVGREWAQVPLDSGTAAVLADGVRILHDPEGLLGRATVSRA